MQDGVVVTQGAGESRIPGRRFSFSSSPVVVRPGLTCKRGRLEAVRDAAINAPNTTPLFQEVLEFGVRCAALPCCGGRWRWEWVRGRMKQECGDL
jgi:hypothetical protein